MDMDYESTAIEKILLRENTANFDEWKIPYFRTADKTNGFRFWAVVEIDWNFVILVVMTVRETSISWTFHYARYAMPRETRITSSADACEHENIQREYDAWFSEIYNWLYIWRRLEAVLRTWLVVFSADYLIIIGTPYYLYDHQVKFEHFVTNVFDDTPFSYHAIRVSIYDTLKRKARRGTFLLRGKAC